MRWARIHVDDWAEHVRASCLDVLFLREWPVDYDLFREEDLMPCGYVFWRGLPPMNRVELRAKLVLVAVPWRMLESTTHFIIVALVGLIACQGGRP